MFGDGVNQFNNAYSFLMMGQSNMAGRGELSDVEPIVNDNCFMFRMGRWQKLEEPVNPDRAVFGIKYHSGVSMGSTFADTISKKLKVKVGLIPCADGGTSIDEWQKGTVLYEHALFMAKLAIKSSELKAILWHQGEADLKSIEKTLSHKKKFIKFITEFRSDLGCDDLPVIIGELSHNYSSEFNFDNREVILNKQYFEISNELKNVKLVTSKNLEMKCDGLHFNAKSQYEFGKRYANKYLELISEQK